MKHIRRLSALEAQRPDDATEQRTAARFMSDLRQVYGAPADNAQDDALMTWEEFETLLTRIYDGPDADDDVRDSDT